MGRVDVAVVGGGIIGLATARAVLRSRPGLRIVVLEKEDRVAVHQSGRNSGVVHAGVYYRPGSMKARTVAAGRRALLEFCRDHGVAHEVIGKVIVAADDRELPALRELHRRAQESNVPADMVGPSRLAELEPHAAGLAALHVPGSAIVDFGQVCTVLAGLLEEGGVELRTGTRVLDLGERNGSVVLRTERGDLEAGVAVNCAGLHSDALAASHRPGASLGLRIVPFRGEYRRLVDHRADLVRTMIYPVPDPRFPFLGAHFSRSVDGTVHVGPNAVLALAREGYSWAVVDFRETLDLLRFPGFRRLALRHWRTGAVEVGRSLWKPAFLRALQRLVPDVAAGDLVHYPAGVRAQAVDAAGNLVDDFVIEESPKVVHILNAPSPAATASLEIGRLVAERVLARC